MARALKTDDFDYDLPPGQIAQEPAEPRDASRLLHLDRATARRNHHRFADLPDLLRPGDLLVLNDTRVLPARFFCTRPSGGKVEGLFLALRPDGTWEVMLKNASRCRVRERLAFQPEQAKLELLENLGRGRWLARPAGANDQAHQGPHALLAAVGVAPLPPYIRRPGRDRDAADREHYQTVYARTPGAVAAPTAGLHFTPDVFARLDARGIERTTVTLHVGLGTFAPVTAADPAEHDMHTEVFELPAETTRTVRDARSAGRRVVAVGTTSVRVLEAAARAWSGELPPQGLAGSTDLFLYPPAEFHVVDALITNFHLPKSTLLMLVAAFCSPNSTAGRELLLAAYAEAVQHNYRFYSYGDAMLIT